MLWAMRVTEGGFICSAAAKSPNEGLVHFSMDASIDACAGDMPPKEEWRNRRLSRVTARRSRAAVSLVFSVSISSPN
jgi:hypothetical protein